MNPSEGKTRITIEAESKKWECEVSHVTWPAILEEVLYGLAGMGYFIEPKVVAAINEATGNYETT